MNYYARLELRDSSLRIVVIVALGKMIPIERKYRETTSKSSTFAEFNQNLLSNLLSNIYDRILHFVCVCVLIRSKTRSKTLSAGKCADTRNNKSYRLE